MRGIDRSLLRLELRACAVDRRPVGLHHRGGGVGLRAGLLGDVLRDDAALIQLLLAFGGELLIFGVGGISRELRFGLREQRAVAHEVGVRHRERSLERPAIEREEQLTLLDQIAFMEGEFLHACR